MYFPISPFCVIFLSIFATENPKSMAAEQPTYTEAYNELQEIVKKMEKADVSVDELTQNIERASLLIKICKEKLCKTEEEVNKIIAQEN